MTNFICATCGTQFAASEDPPAECAICQDPRQFVPLSGQQWTTLEQLRAHHRNAWQECEPGLIGIGSTPEFAIGQRALLLRTQEGNFLWDCVSLIDGATVELIRSLGGLRGIAISHPHYYTTVVEWSRAFHDAPVHLHAADRRMGHAAGSGDSILGERTKAARARGHPDSLRRAFSRRYRSCIGARERTAEALYSRATFCR